MTYNAYKSRKLLEKFAQQGKADYIPFVGLKSGGDCIIGQLKSTKYLVHKDKTVGAFMLNLKNYFKEMPASNAMVLFIKKPYSWEYYIPMQSDLIGDLANRSNQDGFVYFYLQQEAIYG